MKWILFGTWMTLAIVVCAAGTARGEAKHIRVKDLGPTTMPTTVEVCGVAAGLLDQRDWESGTLNWVPDVRSPLIEPKEGKFRNVYAPSVVKTVEGWRIFYGGWDGTATGNDRIYSVVTKDFLTFKDRRIVVDHGPFRHVCNVSAVGEEDGSYRLLCTAYPDSRGLNKPASFRVVNPQPIIAAAGDLIDIEGYAAYETGDLNGMNPILPDGDVWRLYFANFRDFGKIYRASSKDGRHFTFDGVALEFRAAPNDVKRVRTADGHDLYVMGLHMNGPTLWYATSRDGATFDKPRTLGETLSPADRFIVAVGFVPASEGGIAGYLYGAGAVPALNQNRIFARWLQKEIRFVTDDGRTISPVGARGPNRSVFAVEGETPGRFEIGFAVDGDGNSTESVRLIPGHRYELLPTP